MSPAAGKRAGAVAAGIAGAVALAVLLAGCAPHAGPTPPRPHGRSGATLVDHLGWVEEQLDDAIAKSGIPDGWVASYGQREVPWTEDPVARHEILGSLLPRACGHGGQLVQSLVRRNAPDPQGVAQRLRQAWADDGWVVTDVFSVPQPAHPYFRADSDDGAKLVLDATAEGLILKVDSSCSVDPSMAGPGLDLRARDAFLEEILRRGRGTGMLRGGTP